VFTGHFAHWSNEHLAWDLPVFFVLAWLCESAGRRRFAAALVGSSLLIPSGLWTLLPDLNTYRGLSGLDTALFTLLAASALRGSCREQHSIWHFPIAALLACLVGKTVFELLTHDALFVGNSIAGFKTVPLAQIQGAAVGSAIGIVWPRGVSR